MNDIDAWVQWWALPWRYAHPHWQILDASPALLRNQHAGASKSLGIAPCLPCAPTTSLMQLALAQPAHYDALLQRVERICRTTPSAARDDTQRLWCQRLARALHTQACSFSFHSHACFTQLVDHGIEVICARVLQQRFTPSSSHRA